MATQKRAVAPTNALLAHDEVEFAAAGILPETTGGRLDAVLRSAGGRFVRRLEQEHVGVGRTAVVQIAPSTLGHPIVLAHPVTVASER